MFPDRDALGREWPAPLPGPAGRREKPRVIGIVKDIKFGGLDRAAPATLFAPWEKLAPGNAQLVVRSSGRPESLAPALMRAVQQIDPSLPLSTPQTLDEVINGSIADRRLRLQLAAVFAALALALASIALWGAVAQNVLDRRHELAVRVAMGATSASAVRLMLRGGLVLILPGIVAGAAAGAIAARALRHLLHGVSAADPATFAAAGVIVLTVSLLACYLPARRAAGVSPAELLRDN
jgi:predicted lysophospholipase L1 biosynthesis ABC-type transport system permease subunit